MKIHNILFMPLFKGAYCQILIGYITFELQSK